MDYTEINEDSNPLFSKLRKLISLIVSKILTFLGPT